MKEVKKIVVLLFTVSSIAFAKVPFDTSKCDQTIDKKVYKICYSYKYKGALAVWYRLNGNFVNRINIKKRPRFYNEKTIPTRYRLKYSDYQVYSENHRHLWRGGTLREYLIQ